ncbi:MAG TPA: AraC family transcriptional regulator [Phycisphaerae bacterium]|nr:AraC family transcriptional regulator [Phycisphaerae bacterium]
MAFARTIQRRATRPPVPANSGSAKTLLAPTAASPSQKEPDYFSLQITEARRFYLPPQPPAPTRQRPGLSVICCGGEHCSPDYRIIRREFPQLSIEFVAGGEGTLLIAGRSHRLVPGAIFAYGPGVPHEIHAAAAGRPLVKYFLGLQGPEARRLLHAPAPEPGQIVQTAAPDDLLHLWEELISAGLRETPFRERSCAALAEHLLLRIAESALPLGTIGTEAFGTYQRCRHYIETHYPALRGLHEIGAACALDPAYICRLFARYDHQSPWQYALRLKMRAALERLQTPGTLVQDVAAQVGFSDPFQFSRTFRRVFGISPRNFARRHWRAHGTTGH